MLRAIKFEISDDPSLHAMTGNLFDSIGLSFRRPSDGDLQEKSDSELKKACKALGYSDAKTRDEMISRIKSQIPSGTKVFQKFVSSWCMSPIKSKSSRVAEVFRQGRLAEPKIHSNLPSFIQFYSSGMLKLLCQEDGQLVRNVSHSGICSVTPDGFGVLYCSNVLSSSFPDKNKLLSFIETENSSGYANDIASGGIMMTSLEHKHKSSIMTISKCRSILETDLNGTRVKVLNLDDINDRHLFKKPFLPSTTDVKSSTRVSPQKHLALSLLLQRPQLSMC